jgi:hypothetical protein
MGKMIAYIAREANEGALDRRHLRDVIGTKKAQRNERVAREENCAGKNARAPLFKKSLRK